jgi:integrating conjugative element relaxase (TIGR03760 family)
MMETLAVLLGVASLAMGLVHVANGLRTRQINLSAVPPGWLLVLSPEALSRKLDAEPLIAALRAKTGLVPANFEQDYAQTLHRFMAFSQLLPASESHHHAQPGGLLLHALETANIALHLRRAQVLPHGVAPEDIQRREHRWTFGVFLAALIHDVGKTLADFQVVIAKRCGEGIWSPLAGDMATCGAIHYRVTFDVPPLTATRLSSGKDYAAHQRLSVFLMQRLVRQSTLAWVAEDTELLAQLTAFLAGEDRESALARIVIEADRESVRRDLLAGPRTRFASARSVPLIERLMGALRRMVAEGGRLPLNRPGAAGFVADGCIWFVSKRLADEVREYLTAHESAAGIPGPEKNDRLFDVWQEYGALIPNPDTGGAIWRVRVRTEGFDQVLTLLRFPLDKLFADPVYYPAEFAGQVTPWSDAADRHLDLPRQERDIPRDDASVEGVVLARGQGNVAAHSGDPAPGLPPMQAEYREAKPAAVSDDDFLEAVDDVPNFLPKPLVSGRIAPMRLPDKLDKTNEPAQASQEKAGRNTPQPPSEAALRFRGWPAGPSPSTRLEPWCTSRRRACCWYHRESSATSPSASERRGTARYPPWRRTRWAPVSSGK